MLYVLKGVKIKYISFRRALNRTRSRPHPELDPLSIFFEDLEGCISAPHDLRKSESILLSLVTFVNRSMSQVLPYITKI